MPPVAMVLFNRPSPLKVCLSSFLSDDKLQNQEYLHLSIMKPKYHYIAVISSHLSEGNGLWYLLINCK